jgi:S-DNA-T family DNA segregation ATPase FtsK/SpoIIIE
VAADDASSAMSTLTLADRWIFHLDESGGGRGLGLRGVPVGRGRPGRFRVLASGLEGQVACAPFDRTMPTRADAAGGPVPVAALASCVTIASLAERHESRRSCDAVRLLVGAGGDDLGPAVVEVGSGDHVLVVGGARSGVSTALERCMEAWVRDAEARAGRFAVVRIDRRPMRDGELIQHELLSEGAPRVAVVVDEAHRVDDDGTLVRIAQGEFPHVTLLVGARADGVRSAYGHWTREVAKSRCGVVMSSRGDPDGDLLGAQIPRRPLIAARVGLGWIVDAGPLRQVQIAAR